MYTRYTLHGALGAILLAAAVLPVHAQTPVARVNGVAIPQARFDALLKQVLAQGQPDSPELRQRIRDDLINLEAISQEAAKRGIDKQPDTMVQIEITRQQILANAFFRDFVTKNPVSDAVLKAEYDKIRAEVGDREYKARHILVKSEEEARELLALLRKGNSFEKLAGERSLDPGTKGAGGDLGWQVPGRFVKQFGDALLKLKKGQTTQAPVQTQFGFHIIRLDDERPLTPPPYEEVKQQIAQRFQQQLVEKAIGEIRAKAKVE
jgi:peptidyl-prolyl cis-trans isomerase C